MSTGVSTDGPALEVKGDRARSVGQMDDNTKQQLLSAATAFRRLRTLATALQMGPVETAVVCSGAGAVAASGSPNQDLSYIVKSESIADAEQRARTLLTSK